MRPISVERLPEFSPWPARLLGVEPWRVPKRDLARVQREYDRDTYGRCLAFLAAHPRAGARELRQHELGDLRRRVCVSTGNKLFTTTMAKAWQWHMSLLVDMLRPYLRKAQVVVELGCGYGYNLWWLQQRFPDRSFVGGELSRNAQRVARRLFRTPGIQVQHFNYCDTSWQLLRDCPRPYVLFTSHSIEQLPSAAHAVRCLARCKGLLAVCHLEPVVELEGKSLLGLLRRRYAEANDYNRDLLSCLRSHPGIRVVATRHDIGGLNPLNPTSFTAWELRS